MGLGLTRDETCGGDSHAARHCLQPTRVERAAGHGANAARLTQERRYTRHTTTSGMRMLSVPQVIEPTQRRLNQRRGCARGTPPPRLYLV